MNKQSFSSDILSTRRSAETVRLRPPKIAIDIQIVPATTETPPSRNARMVIANQKNQLDFVKSTFLLTKSA